MTYTEQQIRNMKPGPELDDALVQAFGYRGFIRTETGWLYQSEPGGSAKEVSSLSTTWEGMGLVIEELRKHYRVDLLLEEGTNYCSVTDYDDTIEAGSDISAPHAVAMAALLALLALRGGEQG